MSRAILLQHVPHEGPGLIAERCARRGLALDVRHLEHGHPVPDGLAHDELLIVMGGPMNVSDMADARYPFLAAEVELLRKMLASDGRVLGVCLGAQLLAHAAGGAVYPNRQADGCGGFRDVCEVGFGEVTLLHRKQEPALAGLPARIAVLHWHGQTFDLPAGAVHLAESDLCKHQAFRLGRAFGLQFHAEADAEMTRRWVREDAAFVERTLGPGGPAALSETCGAAIAAMRPSGERLIDNILDEMLGRHP